MSYMDIPLAVVFTLLGLAVGSFLNVVIDRLPAGKSLVYPPSRCDACQRRLTPLENVPVFSYLLLGGRCRTCRARIPLRVLWVELLGGALFLLAFWRFGLSPEFGFTAFWSCVFVLIIFIDWEHQLILNKITYPGMVLAHKGFQELANHPDPSRRPAIKHMIVISDGDPSPPGRAVKKALVTSGVTVSTVAVGSHGLAGSKTLKDLATATGGKYYQVRNPAVLPKIFQRAVTNRGVRRPSDFNGHSCHVAHLARCHI